MNRPDGNPDRHFNFVARLSGSASSTLGPSIQLATGVTPSNMRASPLFQAAAVPEGYSELGA